MEHRYLALIPVLLATVSCSATDDGASGDHGGNASGGMTANTGGTSPGGATGSGGSGQGGAVIMAGAGGGTSSPEVCDGIDNDMNGIVDDVDVGGDGICDCLRIATIGDFGAHGMGTLFSAWLDNRGAQAATELGDQELTSSLLNAFDVVVVLNVTEGLTAQHHAFQASEVSALEQWVEEGGGIMSTIGYENYEALEVVNVNALLAFSGMGYDETRTDAEGRVSNWLADHPISAQMGVAQIINGVQPLTTAGTTVAWDVGDRVAMQVLEYGDGHIIVWGDEWITYDELWENSTDLNIELLWLNMFKWLSPVDLCQVPIPGVR
jgi:hypothetical protein